MTRFSKASSERDPGTTDTTNRERRMRLGNGVLHARLAVLAFVGVIALLTATNAGAGTTSVSTVSLSGHDTATNSTATAGGAAGNTAGGDTILWSMQYRNLTGKQAGFDLRDVIPANQTFVPGSLQLPPGLSGRWSTNNGATFSTTEPASGVKAVGAVGSTIDGSTGDQVIVQPDPSTGFVGGTGGGDGWEALFVDDNVYNVHHHRAPGGARMIDCHVKATGAICSPTYAGGGTFASQVAGDPLGTGADTLTTAGPNNGVADQATGRIYFPAGVEGTTDAGVGCIDVRAGVSCGYTHLETAPFASVGWSQLSGGGKIGTKYYLVDANGKIVCFDIATGAACAGLAAPVLAGAPNATTIFRSELETFDNRYVFVNLLASGDVQRDILCFDTVAGAACPGFPIISYGGTYAPGGTTQYNLPLAPTLSPTGAVTGICGETAPDLNSAPYKCFDLTGNPITTPWTQRVANTTVNWTGYGSILKVGTKLYFAQTDASTAATYTCWDFALAPTGTGAPCDGFVQASTGVVTRTYTIRQDPYAPDCIWAVGDAGVFEVFSATFGGSHCQGSQSVIAAAPATHYCDGSTGHVTSWRSLEIGGVTAADYDGVAVTIKGIDGTTVPGWDNRVFPDTQQSIDISTIPITGNTATLSISVSFNNLAAGSTATVNARFDGDPVQVCFKTRVAPAQCSATPPITNNGRVITTVPGGGVTDAPNGNDSGTATFQVANNLALCPPPPPPPAPPRADLEVLKRVNLDVVSGTEPVTWTVTVTNHGPDPAVGTAALDDPNLPVTFILVRSSVGTCTQTAPIKCDLGTLAPGAVATITMIARPKVAGALKNTVRVSSNTPDPTPFNNVASTATTVRNNPALQITKVANKDQVHAGGDIGYRIKVANPSPVAVQTVKVCDKLPSGLVFVSSSPKAKHSDGQYCWDLQTLAAHASKSISLKTRTLRGARGIRSNTARVTGRGVSSKTAAERVNVLAAGAAHAGGVTG
jgi:uncharacterized repeat protein (TIGR01451 family)